jgi:hypothetical protein
MMGDLTLAAYGVDRGVIDDQIQTFFARQDLVYEETLVPAMKI